ncbi:Fe hydrogenase large subunit, C-terminal domain containing protein [Theileria equi strain WA]|uniref:Fe hydrogenase large subunit, C-terminal domain containing protein n=1 Tax=Theileria equi strain WA TaxID=1537102 RepID=L1LAH3_THEEQ|nr:Fe hydrogenase large subunit, C-terminal domain containing protein [Theileria equi strain WA]EKX72477.1 Fe hydrogenase large subunit, C-terminal domain containing protein [Theileria equi strain WA]|eukprot:XP_004831929.1 Fe hydrogenase large subunit, C-terminal domain containing protein [Theileria equi strain WA]
MYSNAVKLGGLNDYLNPSEECILPVKKNTSSYEVKLNRDEQKGANRHPGSQKRDSRVTVGLSDCLSCSGCLTSSEEILMKNDHFVTVIEKLKNAEHGVVSISPQTVYAIAACYGLDPVIAFGKLSHLFRILGAKNIFSMNVGEMIAVHESKVEFVNKFLSSCPVNLQEDYRNGNLLPHDYAQNFGDLKNDRVLPIISNHCPGWTLYAEKMLDMHYIDRISAVSSSQLIQGLVIKALAHTVQFCKILGDTAELMLTDFPGFHRMDKGELSILDTKTMMETEWKYKNIYHVSIAPCYDKRLEALRPQYEHDFERLLRKGRESTGEGDGARHTIKLVDDVLSTSDVQAILNHLGLNFEALSEAPLDEISDGHLKALLKIFQESGTLSEQSLEFSKDANLSILASRHGKINLYRPSKIYCQSGGFAEEIFKFAAENLFGRRVDDVEFTSTINPDFKECILRSGDIILLRFIIAYGYRNVQNVVRMLKDSTNISYIELMSCPGGCFNGPGQVLQVPKIDKGAFNGFLAIPPILYSLEMAKRLRLSLWELVGGAFSEARTKDSLSSRVQKQDSNPSFLAHSIYLETADYTPTQDLELMPLLQRLLGHLRLAVSENVTRTRLEPLKDKQVETSQQLKW